MAAVAGGLAAVITLLFCRSLVLYKIMLFQTMRIQRRSAATAAYEFLQRTLFLSLIIVL